MAKPKAPTKKLRKEFFKAFSGDKADEVAKFLDGGLDPGTMFELDFDDPALAFALDRKMPKVARLLLDRGIDVKIANEKGVTALHKVREADVARELIERGADVHARDSAGRTPLHTAAGRKSLPVVEALVAAGAELDAVDNRGWTAYATAQHVGVRAHLREKGAKTFGPGGGKVIAPTASDEVARSEIELSRGCIGCDREGNTWMWSYSGLFRFDGTTVTRLEFAESFAVQAIAATPGNVYFATNWGLLRYANGEYRLYSHDNSELFDNHLVYAATAPDGRVYMLAYESEAPDKHVIIFDGETFSTLEPGRDYPLGLNLSRIAFDARGEMMLMGHGGYAIKRGSEWEHVTKYDPTSTFGMAVYDMVDDGDVLWFSTQRGLVERRGEAMTTHDTKNLAKHLLKDGDTLWAGTYHGGLARLRGGEIHIFDEKTSKLPNDDVQGLARGADGTIWIHAGPNLAVLRDGEPQKFE